MKGRFRDWLKKHPLARAILISAVLIGLLALFRGIYRAA